MRDTMLDDKDLVATHLERAQMKSPWVSVTVKSKQAMRATLINIKNTVHTLKAAGLIDDFEHHQLIEGFQNCHKEVVKIQTIREKTPNETLFDIPWIDGSHDITIYMHINSVMQSWKKNDILCHEGMDLPGIYVIVEGTSRRSISASYI